MLPGLLSILILIPVLGLLLVLLIPSGKGHLYKYINAFSAFAQLVVCLFVWRNYQTGEDAKAGIVADFQFTEKLDWINMSLGSLGHIKIDYFLGLDGLSMPMVLLSALVMLVGAIASWKITSNQKGYYALYLILSASIMGCFMALDFFLFYLFFELMLLPMYFLIGLWGGPGREYASIKFFLYTLFGSIFILVVIIALVFSVVDPSATAVMAGLAETEAAVTPSILSEVHRMLAVNEIASANIVHSFNMLHMMDQRNFIPGSVLSLMNSYDLFGMAPRLVAFLALFIGFAIKLPAVPVHTWLPDAHVEAPTPVSVILAGVLLKIGSYGILRTAYSMFPEGAIHFAWFIGLLGVISIIYGAFNALAMQDLKKMIAYSSVSHMGFVLLGMASVTVEGINGSIFQMFSHGIISSLLFLIVGVIYDRTSDRMIGSYRGLASKMPVYTTVVTVGFFASLGLPGFSGFIGELFILLGAFRSPSYNLLLPYWMVIVASLGIVIGATYYLWALQRMFFGKFWTKGGDLWYNNLKDLGARELTMTIPLVLLAIFFGLFPGVLFDLMSASSAKLVDWINVNGTQNLEVIQDITR
ncbi:NADH-quinone oxidoreductase subunit M [Cytophagaceae bacterium ABcell3]|nr:NADH-quinone oxidoreductase subunit M [Cytophagaceae bacterium ABcell3]